MTLEQRPFACVAETYERTRRTYPPDLRDHLVAAGVLTPDATVVDLGAGTGQLASLVASVAATVVAVEPEPEMVRVGRQATAHLQAVQWEVGADADLAQLVGAPVDLVLIGNAFHLMDGPQVLDVLDSLVTPAGAVVICSSSVPVWLQSAEWSVAIRNQLETELGRPIGAGGTPDHHRDRELLAASGFSQVDEWISDRTEQRQAASVVGEIMTAASGDLDVGALERLHAALVPWLTDGAVTEQVRTTALVARRPGGRL